jgi:hypothetical protein
MRTPGNATAAERAARLSIWDPRIVSEAVGASLRKLDPRI